MATILRVATANILSDQSRWVERREVLLAGLAGVGADVIALQEVRDPLTGGNARWLADALGGYEVRACAKAGRRSRREGLAVLSRLPVAGDEVLDLGSQRRVAQFVRVEAGGRPVAVVNGHYHFPVGAHRAQVRQVGRVLERVRGLEPGTAVVACGDFNATPEAPAVALMRSAFTSAHRARHGREPAFTCPTPLISGGRVRRAVTRGLLGLFAAQPSDLWRATLDYLFVGPEFRVVDCRIILDQPDPDDPTLYASDHFGLLATLELGGDPPGRMDHDQGLGATS